MPKILEFICSFPNYICYLKKKKKLFADQPVQALFMLFTFTRCFFSKYKISLSITWMPLCHVVHKPSMSVGNA